MRGTCFPSTPNLPQIAIFTKYYGETKGEPSSEYLTKNKVNYSLFVVQLPSFVYRSKLHGKSQVERFPLSYLSNYLKCLLCFGCGDIVTTMKTLLKQEDRKFIKCSPSPLQKAHEHYLKMQTVIFCDKIKRNLFFLSYNENDYLYIFFTSYREGLLLPNNPH